MGCTAGKDLTQVSLVVCNPSTQDIQLLCVCVLVLVYTCVCGISIHCRVTGCSGKLVCDELHMLLLVFLCLCV